MITHDYLKSTGLKVNDIQERLKEEIYQAQLNDRQSRGYMGMSGIGEPCARKVWYRFRNYEERGGNPFKQDDHEGRKYLIFEMGNKVEDIVVEAIEKAGYKVAEAQQAYQDHNGYFKGHCDGVLLDDLERKKYMLEIKSANKSRFDKFQSMGVEKMSPTYWAQIHLYMHYSRIKNGLFLIFNKDNSDIYIEPVEYKLSVARKYIDRAEDILNANEPPEKIGKNEKSKECIFCDFKYLCHDPNGWHVQNTPDCRTCKHFQASDLKFHCNLHDKQIKKIPGKCEKWDCVL